MHNLILQDEEETIIFGHKISELIKETDDSIFEFHLQGDLGAGKTTLVRGILRGLGWEGSVKSPTYTICEEYEFNNFLVLHIDLYRTEIDEDVEMLDLNRPFDGKKIKGFSNLSDIKKLDELEFSNDSPRIIKGLLALIIFSVFNSS